MKAENTYVTSQGPLSECCMNVAGPKEALPRSCGGAAVQFVVGQDVAGNEHVSQLCECHKKKVTRRMRDLFQMREITESEARALVLRGSK